jgi:hypothetical protein
MSGHLLSINAKKVIVLIHGWNPAGDFNSYDDPVDDKEFYTLYTSLKQALQGSDWALVLYHWEADADTGPIITGNLIDNNGAINGTEAAEIAHQHGQHLGELLAARAPGLEEVHFIAHSAGSWAARSATKYLIEKTKATAEVTLLDPFIPGAIPRIDSSLTDNEMNTLAPFSGSGYLWQSENYYSDDGGGPGGTQERFEWDSRGINYEVGFTADGIPAPGGQYGGHYGPIAFYADTVLVAQGLEPKYPDKLNGFDTNLLGWRRSMFEREPIFNTILASQLSASPSSYVSTGTDVVLSVQAITRASGVEISYQLLKDGQPAKDAFGQVLPILKSPNKIVSWQLSQVTPQLAGKYVVQATTHGFMSRDSSPISLTVSGGISTLSLNSVVPHTLSAKLLGERQQITLVGTGFTPNSNLLFKVGSEQIASTAAYLEYVSPTELRYNIAVGPNAAAWTVQVLNGTASSAPLAFSVVTVIAANPPTASFALGSQRTAGQTVSIDLSLGDPDGDYAFANLWVRAPDGVWRAIKADNSLATSGEFLPGQTVATTTGSFTRTFTFAQGSGQYVFALSAIDAAGHRTNTTAQFITVTATAAMRARNLLYADDFTDTLLHWTKLDDDSAGASIWTISDGLLAGYYPLTLDNAGNTGSFLLLADAYQPSGDWTASVDFTWAEDLGDRSWAGAFADFGLASSSSAQKLSISAGFGGTNAASGARASITVQVRYWNGSIWSTETNKTVDLNWTPADWNTATLEKRSHVYRLLVNGVEVLRYTDDQLDGAGKLGLFTHGSRLLDAFLLEQP